MKIKLAAQLKGMNGSYVGSDLVYIENRVTGRLHARAKVAPKNPRTKDQLAARTIARDAARCWSTLPASVRADWEQFTLRFACTQGPRRAMDVCREAQRMRLILGLPTTTSAPRLPFPAPAVGLSEEQSAAPDEFRFRIQHAVAVPAGHMVLVKITPQVPTVACTPQVKAARAICGLGPQSAIDLPENGGVITFSSARFAIESGARFGIALTIIRAEDGLASPVSFFDLIRR
jgi:hypothetical protein